MEQNFYDLARLVALFTGGSKALEMSHSMSFSSHFSFFVLVNEIVKTPKYNVIMFVYFFTEQGKMDKTEI